MSPPPLRPAVDGHNGRPISWPSHPTRTRSARHGFGPPLGPAGREVAVIATLAAEGPAPLHPPTASIRAACRRTAMPSAGEAVALHRFTRLRHRFGLRHAVRRCRQRVKLRAAVAPVAPLHPPTASIRAACRRTAMPSAGGAEGGSGAASPAYGIDSGCDTPYGDAVSG